MLLICYKAWGGNGLALLKAVDLEGDYYHLTEVGPLCSLAGTSRYDCLKKPSQARLRKIACGSDFGASISRLCCAKIATSLLMVPVI
jgi:hypothetical protein